MPIRYNDKHYDFDGDVYTGDKLVFQRPRRGIPITYWRHWYRSAIQNVDALDVSITVRHNLVDPDKVYVAYVSATNVLTVKSAVITARAEGMTWTTELTQANCAFCSLAFDGTFIKDPDNPQTRVVYKTDGLPWLFYVTTGGQLMAGIIGGTYESLVGENVTAIDAVRGVASKYKDIDQGLLVFYVITGSLYYRDLIDGVWGDQKVVSIAPADIVSVRAERTFDYRIVLQVTDTSGALHEIFTKMEASGWAATEYAIKLIGASVTVERTPVTYLEAKSGNEAISLVMAIPDVWQMSIYSPALRKAWNVPIQIYDEETEEYYDDYGYVVVFEFNQIVRNANLYPGDFKLIDDYSMEWVGQTATIDGRFVTVTFNNFNNAENSITAKAVAGNLSNGYTPLSETSVLFDAEGLVPTFVPPPVPVSIGNIEDWSGSL